MDNNDRIDDESLDSVPQPKYEALEHDDDDDHEEKDIYNSALPTMSPEETNLNEYVKEKKDSADASDDEPYDSDHDVEKEKESKEPLIAASKSRPHHSSESNVLDSHNVSKIHIANADFSVEYDDEEDEICDKYTQDRSQSFIEHITADNNKIDPFIVKGNDGMIKKIKICNTSKDVNEKNDLKTKKSSVNSLQNEGQNKPQPRSSTPMSREYLALQRSVNESKILTEFVTETANEKPRKLRAKDIGSSQTTSTTDHSYSTVRRGTQLTPEKGHDEASYNSGSPSQGKRQHSKRYAPLKESESDIDSSSNLRPRSRSKSMHNSEHNLTGSHKKLKKWPSEERLNKRPNMRSENLEFAQKQMEFLQRVIHATEDPRSRSRSRSRSDGGGEGGGVLGYVVGGPTGGGVVLQQQKSNNKSSISSRDRSATKRTKCEVAVENDEQQLLGENAVEQLDDESVNESQASLLGISSLADTPLADSDEVEEHLKSTWQPAPKPGYDSFCWKCHETKVNLCCCKCIRSFHAACIKIYKFDNIWLCPECTAVENMLNNPKRSKRSELSIDLLSQLLSFALKRMRYTKGHFNFVMPYEETPIYKKYIVNPVTLMDLQTKIEMKEFRCAEEFVNETKWMLHNAYILSNRNNTKIVVASKSIFKICRQEANEIETCAECYLNANTRTDWFVDVCSQPHLLLWAKLKGFPYWPAKAMGLGQNSLINVRFFGEHDRAFVPLKDCFLYSEQDPNTATGKRAARELADCIKEVEEHIGKIKSKVGGFKYAPFKTPYDPAYEIKQLSAMMPGVEDFIRKQQGTIIKPSLQFKIYKTADNNLSIVQKASTTPELPSSSHDSEEKDKLKVKKVASECIDSKKLEETTTSAAKYEVVSKVSSDDSNSSKLSTVILKRKSINGDSKKTNEDEIVEFPLPKMTKIEDHKLEEDNIRLNVKRKLDAQSVEKPKAKHSKLEPKIPIITIKTAAVVKEASNSLNLNEVNTKTPTKIQGNNNNKNSKQITSLQQSETNETSSGATQKTMETLVKQKQGVTIKKISKELKNNNTEPDRLNNSEDSLKDGSVDKKDDNNKSVEEKAKENQKVNNILKGLVPFVEVKKEVISDNEEEAENQQNEKTVDKETELQDTNANNDNNDNSSKTLEAQANETQPNSNKTEDVSKDKTSDNEVVTTLITQVKEEVVSDEEGGNAKAIISPNQTTIITKLSSSDGNNSVEKPNCSTSACEVRVVGETTIQKLSSKNNQNQYLVYNTGTSPTNNSCGVSAKRTSLKGIPYGPLPASAFPKSLTSKTFQHTDINLQPRAKKSFSQHSPPIEKLRPCANQNVAAQIPSQSSTQHLDQKRTMSKNTMVTIPVDVSTNRASTSSGTIIIGSIPVPPLTAVSKTVLSTVASNSMAQNSPATITVSGTSSSLTTPAAIAQAKLAPATISSTTTTAVINSPITVSTSSSLTLMAPSAASLTSAPLLTNSTLNPLTMTTPPPLAGLSNNSVISTPQTNGVSDTTIALPAAPQPSTDNHILGGLVTPTLASAITDVICRGPPKLAARPTGPLQSEGHPMFPSQAGPVCKRLVENVHKLTDFFISVVEDTMGEMAQGEDPSLQAKITLLTIELERNKQAYEQEIAELKRTSDLMLCEMRKSMENEKTRLAIEIRKQCEMERLRSVEETKRKQWCANCFREANFYCCWNTSYCDYPCQQLHWSRHSHTCAQTRVAINETTNAATTTTQTERHHNTKPNSAMTLGSAANFTKSPNISQKKEKISAAKNSTNHMMSSAMATAIPASASRTNTEVLKLPSNTYLRPVTSNVNNQALRCNTTYSIPVQRFNALTPITTPTNTNSPQTYTIVQQGNSWVMSSSGNNNSGNSSATNPSTIAAPIVSVPQVTGQPRSSGNNVTSILTNKSQKSQIRYH